MTWLALFLSLAIIGILIGILQWLATRPKRDTDDVPEDFWW